MTESDIREVVSKQQEALHRFYEIKRKYDNVVAALDAADDAVIEAQMKCEHRLVRVDGEGRQICDICDLDFDSDVILEEGDCE